MSVKQQGVGVVSPLCSPKETRYATADSEIPCYDKYYTQQQNGLSPVATETMCWKFGD